VTPLALFTNIGASALALNRDAAGSMQTFHVAGASASGIISCTTTTTTYGTTSDVTLKDDEGVLDSSEAQRVIDSIVIHKFKWRINGESDTGVFAQELHSVYPKAVIAGGWVDDEGNPSSTPFDGWEGANYQSWAVDYSKLVPVMLSAMQAMQARIKQLEEKA
jgi:hypothetical protein